MTFAPINNPWGLQEIIKNQTDEISRLRRRVVELEDESGNLRKQLQVSYEQEVNSRGHKALRDARDKWMQKAMDAEKRVAELEKLADSQAATILRLEKGGYKKDAGRYRVCRILGCEFGDTHTLYEEELDAYCDAVEETK